MEYNYSLKRNDNRTIKLAKTWLFLGIFSLLFSGIFSILLVLSRTPVIQDMIPFIDFFHTALVVHVDLSVLIWFTSFAGVLWTMTCKNINNLDWLAVYTAIVGTLIIIITPFIMDGYPLMNNYIPILQTPVFYLGLGLFILGLTVRIIRTLSSPDNLNYKTASGALSIGSYSAALTALFAILTFIYTWITVTKLTSALMPQEIESALYFELLFWGAGHIIQFTHMLLMFVIWMSLLQFCHAKISASPSLISSLFVVTFLPVLFSPIIYFQYDLFSAEFHQAFTHLMKFGSLTALPLGLIFLYFLLHTQFFQNKGISNASIPFRNALWSSLVLFAAGGFLGFMIKGDNVIIPAHYHGSIVGITLAFMGFTFYLLPYFNYPLTPKAFQLAKIQPIIYAAGQLMHITGLTWSGGYGVKRKTAGNAQSLENLPEIIGMTLMGLGGLIAIIGGILFIIIAILSIRHKK